MKNRTIDGFTFELVVDEDTTRYECKGATYFDDEHDQVPEPKLWEAAEQLESDLKAEGLNANAEQGEKGWVEIYIQ